MYNWQLTSFIFFTSVFWGVEIFVTAAIWLGLSMALSSGTKTQVKKEKAVPASIKQETDTSEYTIPKVKQEEKEPALHEISPASEGDVEDEEELEGPVMVEDTHRAGPSDSGLGTSLESSHTRQDTIRRRTSRQGLEKS
jgi:seipin